VKRIVEEYRILPLPRFVFIIFIQVRAELDQMWEFKTYIT